MTMSRKSEEAFRKANLLRFMRRVARRGPREGDLFRFIILLVELEKTKHLKKNTTEIYYQEFRRIKHHAVQGELILKTLAMPFDVCRSVRCHHERYNGRGYPDGLSGDEIPIEARILCVADAYDAMTADRPYRSAMHGEAASSWIRNLSGVHFDPEVVDSFLAVEVWPSVACGRMA